MIDPETISAIADDLGVVTEALLASYRGKTSLGETPAKAFARLQMLAAGNRGTEPSVTHLALSSQAVLELAASVLSDIEVGMRTLPDASAGRRA